MDDNISQVKALRPQKPRERKANRQGVSLNKEFLQFIQDDQFKCLVEYHPLTSTKTDKWQQQVLVFYDLLIDYFLKHNPQFILLQDPDLKLEIKQYFVSNPIEMQVLTITDNRIQDFKVGLYYNRQLNVYGFIIPTPNGYITRGKYHQIKNLQQNLFIHQDDILQKYKDNRVNVIYLLNSLNITTKTDIQSGQPPKYDHLKDMKTSSIQNGIFARLYSIIRSQLTLNAIDSERLQQSTKRQLIYKIVNDTPLESALQQFLQILSKNNSDVVYLIDTQGSIQYANTLQIIQFLNRLGVFHLFLSFITKLETEKVVNVQSVVIQSNINKIVHRNISLSQNYDLNFDLRVLQYLYKQSFGFNDQVRNAKTPQDFYAIIPTNLISIMQEKLEIFKSQKANKCPHLKLVQDLHLAVTQNEYEYAYTIIQQIIQTYATEIPQSDQVKVRLGMNVNDSQVQQPENNVIDEITQELSINYDNMYCRQCSQQILCYHELLNILKSIEKISLEQYEIVVQDFLVRDLDIFQFSSFCSVCGGAFPIKLELQQMYDQLDPLKKYTVLKKTFKILFVTIITSFQFPQSSFLKDFIQQYYYPLKQELLQFKHQSNYAQRKQKLVALFVSAYIYSLKGDNVAIDLKTLYKYAQQTDLAYDQFLNTLTQLQDKFGLQSSIVIPSLVTVKHLYNNLRNKPIIGQIIQNDPIKLSKLLEQQIPLYPSMYDMDKYIPYFNVDIQTLSPQVISRVLDTAAVDIENRQSSVVNRYVQVKTNAGRHLERNSTSYSNRLVYVDHYRYKEIPKSFIIENYKREFYELICPITKLAHTTHGKCDKCKSIDINKIDNGAFHQLFFKTNNLALPIQNKYPEITPIAIPFNYSTNTLYNLSKEYLVHPLQIQNFGGFSFIESRSIQQFNNLESLVVHQIEIYYNIFKSFTYSTISNNIDIPSDLKFVLKYDYNWTLYQSRLNTITNRIKEFLTQFNTLSATINIAQRFDINVNTLRQGGTKNAFIVCQIVLYHFFVDILNELKQHVNEGILKQKMKDLFYEDITRIDQYSISGSFRHKTVKEIDAEAIQAEIKENMVYVDEYVELDEDNDLIESLKKGTMDEDDYDESYRN